MENIPKIVFSRTLKNLEWKSAKLSSRGLKEEVLEMKQQPGKDLLVGSPSLITQCLQLNLVDECQFMVHPTIVGKGLPLFKGIADRIELTLLKTKSFRCGAVLFYYTVKKG